MSTTNVPVAIYGDPTNPVQATARIVRNWRWNGWAECAFTRAEAERIAAAVNKESDPRDMRLDWQGDSLLEITDDGAEKVDTPTTTDPVTGETLWWVGNGWCWSEVDPVDRD